MNEAALRARIDELEEEVRQLREKLAPPALHEAVLVAAQERLRLTHQQARFLAALCVSRGLTDTDVVAVIGSEGSLPKIAQVIACHVRRRLPESVRLDRRRSGYGFNDGAYILEPGSRRRLLEFLGVAEPVRRLLDV